METLKFLRLMLAHSYTVFIRISAYGDMGVNFAAPLLGLVSSFRGWSIFMDIRGRKMSIRGSDFFCS